MDPFFKPILYGAAVALISQLLAQFLGLSPIFCFLGAGFFSVYIFKKQFKEKGADLLAQLKRTNDQLLFSDVSILGLGTGIVAGSINSFLTALALQDPATREKFIDHLNETMKMTSTIEFTKMEPYVAAYLLPGLIIAIFLFALIAYMGAIFAMAVLNRKWK